MYFLPKRVLAVLAAIAFCIFHAGVSAQVTSQFTIDITTIIDAEIPGEGQGYAAVGFDGTNLWAARWASDRFTRITPAGAYVDSFVIPGLTGTRSMTWDGTHFWIGNATTTIYRVDPTTQMVDTTVTVPVEARYLTFDETADGGNGGFWLGNFNTDIIQIDMSGNLLATIPAATVGFQGRYGLAFDNVTDSGPILWVFFQEGANTTELGILELPSGNPKPDTQDLFPFMPAGSTSSLAGGIFLTSGLVSGENTLLALGQGTPVNAIMGFQPAATLPVELIQFEVD